MRILGRDIAPGRIPRVVHLLLTAAFRAVVKFSDPLTVLRCYARRTPPPGNRLSLRGGGELALSSYPGDIVTAFVVFCKEEYGTDFAGKTVLDIGANIGCFALLACRHGCRDLVAVEPSPEAFEVLSGNLVGNGFQGRARVIHAAVSGVEQGSVAFPRASSAMNSLDATEGDLVQVPTVTLGALLEQHFPAGLDLLKLDCEGAEVAILAQASDADLGKITEIRMEFHGADHGPTEQRLHRAGFRTVAYDRPGPLTAQLWLRRG